MVAGLAVVDEVSISQKLLEVILQNARSMYPRETILLLRGRVEKGRITITDIIIPPFATRGKGFSSFPLHMLPIDFSLVGSVHSHPSGNTTPSVEDVNHSYGRIAMIVAYPFMGKQHVSVCNHSGEEVPLELT